MENFYLIFRIVFSLFALRYTQDFKKFFTHTDRFLGDSEMQIESFLGHIPVMWDCHCFDYSDLSETPFCFDYLV